MSTDARLANIRVNLLRETSDPKDAPFVSAMDVQWLVDRVEALTPPLDFLARAVGNEVEASGLCFGCVDWALYEHHGPDCKLTQAFDALGWHAMSERNGKRGSRSDG